MIKNYTSQVPAQKSINHIEDHLVKHGARRIMKLYNDDHVVTGICFEIPENGQEIPYKILARISECEVILNRELGPKTRTETRKKIPKQSERTAWKILSDWVEVQMARVEIGQIVITEAYLPYMYDPKSDQTFYEKLKHNGFENLLEYKA